MSFKIKIFQFLVISFCSSLIYNCEDTPKQMPILSISLTNRLKGEFDIFAVDTLVLSSSNAARAVVTFLPPLTISSWYSGTTILFYRARTYLAEDILNAEVNTGYYTSTNNDLNGWDEYFYVFVIRDSSTTHPSSGTITINSHDEIHHLQFDSELAMFPLESMYHISRSDLQISEGFDDAIFEMEYKFNDDQVFPLILFKSAGKPRPWGKVVVRKGVNSRITLSKKKANEITDIYVTLVY